MADRELFAWKGAAIMGEDGRPKYARVEPEFIGSPVWGKGGAIAALLARVERLEAAGTSLMHAGNSLTDETGNPAAWIEATARWRTVTALAGAPAAPPEPSDAHSLLVMRTARMADAAERVVKSKDSAPRSGYLEWVDAEAFAELRTAVAALRARKEEQGG